MVESLKNYSRAVNIIVFICSLITYLGVDGLSNIVPNEYKYVIPTIIAIAGFVLVQLSEEASLALHRHPYPNRLPSMGEQAFQELPVCRCTNGKAGQWKGDDPLLGRQQPSRQCNGTHQRQAPAVLRIGLHRCRICTHPQFQPLRRARHPLLFQQWQRTGHTLQRPTTKLQHNRRYPLPLETIKGHLDYSISFRKRSLRHSPVYLSI